jgi:nucleoside-diphosphate-sugar epimerase
MDESKVTTGTTVADWVAGRKGGVAITGASGWIGSALVHHLVQALPDSDAIPLRVFGSTAGALEISGRSLAVEPLCEAGPLGDGEWLVLHFAVVGADRLGGDATALKAANDVVLDQALALAATGAVRRFVHASSGAIYQTGGSPTKHAYSDMKRAQEHAVRAWSSRTGAPLLIPRIFNVGGPYINHVRAYAVGDFIAQALAGSVIRIEARRPVFRSYVHVHELARVIFDLALKDAGPTTFDTAGPEIVEMADLASAVGTALNRPLEIRRPPMEVGEDRYVGDGRIYQAALARSGAVPVGLDRIVRDTADFMRRSWRP